MVIIILISTLSIGRKVGFPNHRRIIGEGTDMYTGPTNMFTMTRVVDSNYRWTEDRQGCGHHHIRSGDESWQSPGAITAQGTAEYPGYRGAGLVVNTWAPFEPTSPGVTPTPCRSRSPQYSQNNLLNSMLGSQMIINPQTYSSPIQLFLSDSFMKGVVILSASPCGLC